MSLFFKNTKKERDVYRKFFYSQDGEDAIILSFFEDKPDYKGFYVDLGAHHPFRFSNTQVFYEKGWRGINVDATPGAMHAFREYRSEDVNLEIGVQSNFGLLDYYIFEESALNSFDKNVSEQRVRDGWKLRKIVKVETCPINYILQRYMPTKTRIDFLSIDIEGSELSILESLDFEKYPPTFLLIEELNFVEKDYTMQASSLVYNLLYTNGYKPVAKTMRTVIYKKV